MLKGEYVETTSGAENCFGSGSGSSYSTIPASPMSSSPLLPFSCDVPNFAFERRDMRQLSIPLNRGAQLMDGEYTGFVGGTLVIMLVRIPVSILD